MEGFQYVDIFETKGIEYLLVIGFLLMLVVAWRYLNRPGGERSVVGHAARRALGEAVAALEGWFRLDDSRYYHAGHGWAAPQSESVAAVGVDDFAQRLLGRPEAIGLPEVGTRVVQGERAWSLRVHEAPIGMLSPVSGEVVAVNERLRTEPELINDDPYGEGWLIKVKSPTLGRDLRNLLSGRWARSWMNETVSALRERMSGDLGTVLQDGGVPTTGFVFNLDADDWREVVGYFLGCHGREEVDRKPPPESGDI